MTRVAFCSWAFGLGAFASVGGAAVQYTVTPIFRQTAGEPQRYAINSAGDIVGTYESAHGLHAFLFSNGVFTDLGSGNVPSYAQGINSSGQIVMNFGVAGGDFHAGLYDHGVFTDLTNATAGSAGGPLRRATGINDLGHVVGINDNGAATFDGVSVKDLGTIDGGASEGFGINNSDHVAGSIIYNSGTNAESSLAFYYDGMVHNLTPTPPIQTEARAINASNQIVGATIAVWPNGFQAPRAFLYGSGVMSDLGSMGGNYSEAIALNDLGQVVGWTGTGAFIYQNGLMSDLNSMIDPASGWHLIEADAINNSGEIVTLASAGKLNEVLLLTPVPEPVISVIGMVVVLGRRRRHTIYSGSDR